MALQRRVAAPPPVSAGVNFGSLDMYAGGAAIPEGDYAVEFTVQMHSGFKQTNAPARLGVMLTCHPLDGSEPKQTFMSMGSQADKSFAPDPETGKGLVLVPGAPGQTLNNQTNWALFLKSLYDCGLPQGIFTNDFSTIDGVHVHLQSIPEPEERKGFGAGAATGEAAAGGERKAGLTTIVTEIKEDGKPWEGSGGLPGTAPAPAAPKTVAGRIAPKAAAAPKKVAAPVVEGEQTPDEDELRTAAINGISSVLEVPGNQHGVTKLLLRTGTFKYVNTNVGAAEAQAVISTYFGSDEALNSVLGSLGYVVKGQAVQPAE